MKERDVAVRNAKAGYVAIVGMLIVNLMLASFVFFGIDLFKNRELFLSAATFFTLLYAVTFPTKLLPSGVYLLRCIIFILAPQILIQLLAMQYSNAVTIVAYVMCVVMTLFCAYINLGYHKKVMKYVSEENFNDYSLFEFSTYKIHEVNIYTLAYILVNFFLLMTIGTDIGALVIAVLNILIGIGLDFYRCKACKSDRIKMYLCVLESLSTILAVALVIIVNMLDLSKVIYIGAVALIVPTIAMTIAIYRSVDKFMYK